jgi:hypothetical protein
VLNSRRGLAGISKWRLPDDILFVDAIPRRAPAFPPPAPTKFNLPSGYGRATLSSTFGGLTNAAAPNGDWKLYVMNQSGTFVNANGSATVVNW